MQKGDGFIAHLQLLFSVRKTHSRRGISTTLPDRLRNDFTPRQVPNPATRPPRNKDCEGGAVAGGNFLAPILGP